MKEPIEIYKLAKIKLPKISVVPTIQSASNDYCLLLEMNDGSIFEYHNEERLELVTTATSKEQFLKDCFGQEFWANNEEDFSAMYWEHEIITKALKKELPNLKQAWLGNL